MPRRKRNDEPPVRIPDVVCKHMTPKALLCVIHGEEMWIPLSQVDDDSEVFNDSSAAEGTLIISRWIAGEKSLLPDDGDAFTDLGT